MKEVLSPSAIFPSLILILQPSSTSNFRRPGEYYKQIRYSNINSINMSYQQASAKKKTPSQPSTSSRSSISPHRSESTPSTFNVFHGSQRHMSTVTSTLWVTPSDHTGIGQERSKGVACCWYGVNGMELILDMTTLNKERESLEKQLVSTKNHRKNRWN